MVEIIRTSQIVEVGFLVELIEDCSGSVLDVGRCEYCYTILRKLFGKSGSTVVIFKRSDTGSDYVGCQHHSAQSESGFSYVHPARSDEGGSRAEVDQT